MQNWPSPSPSGTPGPQEAAVGREHLHPVVEGICDEHLALAIDRDPFGLPELARPASFRTPRTHEHALAREDLDPGVDGISHIHKTRSIQGDRNGPAKLTRAVAGGAPHVKESAIRIEDLHAAVVVCHEDSSGFIHGDPAREAEVALQGPPPMLPT